MAKQTSSNLVSKGKTVSSTTVKSEVKKMENGKTEKQPEKKVFVASVEQGIADLIAEGQLPAEVPGLIEQGIIKAVIDQANVDDDKFSGDYIRLTLGDGAKTDDDVIMGLLMIANGNLRAPFKEDGETRDMRKPSLEKFALYGADLASRSRVSQRVKAAAEGPERAIERMADQLQKAKPGMSREKAMAKAVAMLEDDGDE